MDEREIRLRLVEAVTRLPGLASANAEDTGCRIKEVSDMLYNFVVGETDSADKPESPAGRKTLHLNKGRTRKRP